jgi:hypothetical protein
MFPNFSGELIHIHIKPAKADEGYGQKRLFSLVPVINGPKSEGEKEHGETVVVQRRSPAQIARRG